MDIDDDLEFELNPELEPELFTATDAVQESLVESVDDKTTIVSLTNDEQLNEHLKESDNYFRFGRCRHCSDEEPIETVLVLVEHGDHSLALCKKHLVELATYLLKFNDWDWPSPVMKWTCSVDLITGNTLRDESKLVIPIVNETKEDRIYDSTAIGQINLRLVNHISIETFVSLEHAKQVLAEKRREWIYNNKDFLTSHNLVLST